MKRVALVKLLKITKQFLSLRTFGHLWNALEKLHYADIATLVEYLSRPEGTRIIELFFEKEERIPKLAEVVAEIKPEVVLEL